MSIFQDIMSKYDRDDIISSLANIFNDDNFSKYCTLNNTEKVEFMKTQHEFVLKFGWISLISFINDESMREEALLLFKQ